MLDGRRWAERFRDDEAMPHHGAQPEEPDRPGAPGDP
jgi:hypothetical protein